MWSYISPLHISKLADVNEEPRSHILVYTMSFCPFNLLNIFPMSLLRIFVVHGSRLI